MRRKMNPRRHQTRTTNKIEKNCGNSEGMMPDAFAAETKMVRTFVADHPEYDGLARGVTGIFEDLNTTLLWPFFSGVNRTDTMRSRQVRPRL